nr:serine/threonine-protein kinase ICK [Nothobranchius furzeri]
MNRYTTIRQLGDGTYGSVILGRSLESGELVAIKKMKRKFYSWEECMNLREVKSLKKLIHENVIKLKEVFRENDHLYFIFEYMKENLYQLMKDRSCRDSHLSTNMVRMLLSRGYFHRDMKPENLLCMGPELVKIADFGLAREIRSRPPYTDYVSTRCAFSSRSPSLLYRQQTGFLKTLHESPLQLIFIVLSEQEDTPAHHRTGAKRRYGKSPLFTHLLRTAEKDKRQSRVNDWAKGYQLASAMNFRWPQCVPNNLKTLIPNASPDAIHLMTKLLQWDPRKRPASAQALRYSYFHVGQALGTPQQILEQGRPQLGLVHLQTPLQMQQQQPLLLKPVPPSQPPPSNQHCSSSRPLHQIQTSPAPAAAQAAAYQRHTEMVRKQQQPNHILKQEQTEGTSQRRLPYIVDKGHQEKQTQQDVHNLSLLGYQLKPKGGRRRWGHAAGHVKGEDWDNYEETDPSSISILGKPNFSSEKSRQGDDSLSRFGTVLDFSRRSGKEDAPLNLNKTAAYQEPSRTASAKQHYLRQSRYLPGISTKKNIAMNASKEFPGSHFCGSSSIAFGGTLPSRGAHGTNTIPGDYMPSFYKKDNGSVGHSRGRQGVSMETSDL